LPRYESVSKMGLNMVGAAVVVPDASDGTEPENPYDGECRPAGEEAALFPDAPDTVPMNPAFMD
jgi:hypothetical protein